MAASAFLRFKDYYVWVGFLKINPLNQSQVMKLVSELLEDLSGQPRSLLVGHFGPFVVYGQFDIVFGYCIENIDHGARLFYAMLDTINDCLTSAQYGPIRDFHRIVAFEWDHHITPPREMPCLAYFTAKMNYIMGRNSERLRVSDLIETLTTSGDENKSQSLYYRILGTLCWNEVMVLIYGYSYENLSSIIRKLPQTGIVSHLTPLILRDPSSNLSLPNSWWLVSQLSPMSCVQAVDIRDIIPNTNIEKIYSVESLNDYIIATKFSNSASVDPFVESLARIPGLEYTNSGLYTITNAITPDSGKTCGSSPSPPVKLSPRKLEGGKVFANLEKITNMPIARRKLKALLTQVKILQGIGRLSYLFPEKLIRSIEYLEKDSYMSDDTINYYITELSMAITERLAGVQMDVLVGKDLGFLEKHGGFQRVLLACESLLQRLYSAYLDKKVGSTFKSGNEPPLFVFFDYGARLSSEIPAEILGHGMDENLPVIIRLRMLRYKPWLWITGVRELGKLLYFITGTGNPLEVLQDDPEVASFSDLFLRQFLIYENFKKVLAEELGFFVRRPYLSRNTPNRYYVRPQMEQIISDRIQVLDQASSLMFVVDEFIDGESMEQYQRSLLNGQIVFDLRDDGSFLNFLNAYHSLDLSQQSAPRPLVAFALSLFWNHRDLLRRSI
jgi:hypothetical protein